MTVQPTALPSDKLIGFFLSSNMDDDEQVLEQIKDFVWGEHGLDQKLQHLKWFNYGEDFQIILFQFYVDPIPYLTENLKEIENYRPKEKSIGIPIILESRTFLNLSTVEQNNFIKSMISDKLELLSNRIRRNKLNLQIDKLINDINSCFGE